MAVRDHQDSVTTGDDERRTRPCPKPWGLALRNRPREERATVRTGAPGPDEMRLAPIATWRLRRWRRMAPVGATLSSPSKVVGSDLLLPIETRLLHQLRSLRPPLSQVFKNGLDGLRHALVQGRAQERPTTRRLFCLL